MSKRDEDYMLTFEDEANVYDAIVSHVLEGSNDIQVVIGPLVRPPLGNPSNQNYFMIASSEEGQGFRCGQVTVGDDWDEGLEHRNKAVGAFIRFGIGRGLVVYDTDDEFEAPGYARRSGQGRGLRSYARQSKRKEKARKI
jgi:hypothetical protein